MSPQKLDRPQPAIVTGGSRGLGRAAALALADLGCPVTVNYLNNEIAAQAVVDEISANSGRALAVRADVTREDEVRKLIDRARDAFGSAGILINNAGIGPVRDVSDLTVADFDQVISANLRSAFIMTQAALPDMLDMEWGRLIFMSSLAARVGGVISAPYAASKAGAEGLMHYYATHLLKYRVTSNAIAPAFIETDMFSGIQIPPKEQLPLGRMGRPDEVGIIVQALVLCEFMTGQTIHLNAGRYQT
jgi:3-oxoacyl-[acyl-carrier protein] reductase